MKSTISISQKIFTNTTLKEVQTSISESEYKTVKYEKHKLELVGKTFFDFSITEFSKGFIVTGRPKNKILYFVSAFLLVFIFGFSYKNGLLIGIPIGIFASLFFLFIARGLLKSQIEEFLELIKRKT